MFARYDEMGLSAKAQPPFFTHLMVATGLGITCTNAIIGEAFTKGVRYLPLSPKQPIEIGIAIPKKKEMSPAAKRFAEFAREQF